MNDSEWAEIKTSYETTLGEPLFGTVEQALRDFYEARYLGPNHIPMAFNADNN